MKGYFQQLAKYNQWANGRLYAAVLELPNELYRKPTGVFFGSLHGTLNHLLLTDRLWLKRLTGIGEELPNQLAKGSALDIPSARGTVEHLQ